MPDDATPTPGLSEERLECWWIAALAGSGDYQQDKVRSLIAEVRRIQADRDRLQAELADYKKAASTEAFHGDEARAENATLLAELESAKCECIGERKAKELVLKGLESVTELYDGMKHENRRLQGIIAAHDLCHDLHGKVGPQEFADGCAAEQRKLYGCAPDRDELARLRDQLAATESLNLGLAERVHKQSELLSRKAELLAAAEPEGGEVMFKVVGPTTTNGALHCWHFPTEEIASQFAKQQAAATGKEVLVCKLIGRWKPIETVEYVQAPPATTTGET